MTTLRLYGKSPRCWWCGKKMADELRQVKFEMSGKQYETAVCSEEHGRAVLNAYAYVKKTFLLFPIGMAIGLITFIGGDLFSWGKWATFSGLAVMGATIIVCPFTTPQTTHMIGLKKSFRIGRVGGVILFIGALVMMILFR